MTEKEKALTLIKKIRDASYNHAYYGTDMSIDEETAVSLVEEIFEVEETINWHLSRKGKRRNDEIKKGITNPR